MKTNRPTTPQYISEDAAAAYIGMSVSYLQKSRVTGSLPGRPCPPFIRLGRAVRYSIADLDAFMAQHRVDLSGVA